MDRTVVSDRVGDRPAVVLVVGVNGAGKTTTVGKLARVLVAMDKDVVLGAADTFRAAAADQRRPGASASVCRRSAPTRDMADPASVAFDAVKAAAEYEADVVLIDTAGRLHTKVGLMDEPARSSGSSRSSLRSTRCSSSSMRRRGRTGCVRPRSSPRSSTSPASSPQKLDGTAKGGIVVQVQRRLGIPVKGWSSVRGPDDLAPSTRRPSSTPSSTDPRGRAGGRFTRRNVILTRRGRSQHRRNTTTPPSETWAPHSVRHGHQHR